jgi:hypothetical protein
MVQHSAILGVLAATKLGFGLALAEIFQTSWCMFEISPEEPAEHCNITHCTNIDEVKLFSSAMLGVLALNNIGFGLALAEICQYFGQQKFQGGIACPKSVMQSLLNIVTSLIGSIGKK